MDLEYAKQEIERLKAEQKRADELLEKAGLTESSSEIGRVCGQISDSYDPMRLVTDHDWHFFITIDGRLVTYCSYCWSYAKDRNVPHSSGT